MDKKYWEDYYKEHGKDEGIILHSSFSDFCLNNFSVLFQLISRLKNIKNYSKQKLCKTLL